jgi:hypothetical protein
MLIPVRCAATWRPTKQVHLLSHFNLGNAALRFKQTHSENLAPAYPNWYQRRNNDSTPTQSEPVARFAQ